MTTCRIFSVVTILIITALFVSCAQENIDTDYVRYRLNADPTTLDPAYIVDVTGGAISAKLFNGLVRLDERLNIVPDIAESWSIQEDGRKYVFKIKRGVRFSSGREVTADDFRYSFERVLSPQGRSPNTWVLDKISGSADFIKGRAPSLEGIQMPDSHTLVLSLEKPFSPFLELLTMTAAYVVPAEVVERYKSDFGSHPVGTGPFILTQWSHNTRLRLDANRAYFNGTPKIKGMTYRIIPEDLTAVTEFELGNLDLISIPVYEYSRFTNSPKWRPYISSVEGLNTYYLGFNCSRAPFNSAELRKAVALAIDKEKILATFYEKRGRLALGPVPDTLRNWSAPQPVRYDPVLAKKLVAASGLGRAEIKFYVNADPEVIDIAEIIQSFLKEAGLTVRITRLEWSAYKAAINKGEADIFWLSWWADYPDPENFLFPLFHSSNYGASGNRSRYINKDVDALIETGQQTLESSGRQRLYGEAEHLIVKDIPWVFFWHKNDYILRQPRLRHYKTYQIYSMDKGMEIAL